ncbi:MAG: hypothetical protein J6T94_05760 [Bacteroidaceae bacterium]|nr:hypothetical protein [Bacteroidaceae bacterium]
MKKLLITLAALLCLTACNSNKPASAESREVPFEIAHGYFFRNGQTPPTQPLIASEAEFSQLFGMAAFMGPNGTPTSIDFQKQCVLAIVLPITDVSTEIIPQKVEEAGRELRYTYEVKTGEKQTFSIQPVSIIVLDKKYASHKVELIRK